MDDVKPTKILPATSKQTISKRLFNSDSDESDTSHEKNSENEDQETDASANEGDFDDGMDNAIERLKKTWRRLSPFCDRKQYIGKVVCYHLHDQKE